MPERRRCLSDEIVDGSAGALLVGVLAVVAAGCGGDDDEEAGAPPEART